jgi:hypothetical protein
MPRAQAGVAAATATTSRQFGQTLGVAVAGAIVNAGAGRIVPGRLAGASHPVWFLCVGCGALILVLALVATSARARASALRVATELNPEALEASAAPTPTNTLAADGDQAHPEDSHEPVGSLGARD